LTISFYLHFYRKGQLTFENGETELELDFSILQDTTPEQDETFSIVLSNSTGKAVLGLNKQLTVTILSNNNAHGRIGFSVNSLRKVQAELRQDTVVSFEVLRENGQFGRVVVWWNATGDFRPGEISPVSGALVFADGEHRHNISITVHKDNIPELDKEIKIRYLTLLI
jgi:G-protein coupled receptor 98